MFEIKVGETLKADKVFSGTSDRGDYEFIKVVEDKQGGGRKKEITVNPSKLPSGVAEGGQFVLTKINSVRLSARKYKDVWSDTFGVDADISVVAAPANGGIGVDGSDFDDMVSSTTFDDLTGDDGGLPF